MLLKNCRLVGALSDGVSGEGCWVRLEKDRIAAVGTDAVSPAVGEEVFDCGGRTLLPGLMDIHTHMNGLVGFRPRDVEDPMGLFVNTAGIWTTALPRSAMQAAACGSTIISAMPWSRDSSRDPG